LELRSSIALAMGSGYTNLAWAYYKLGDKDKAIYYLDKALNYNPRYSVAYFYRGLIALEEDLE
uniref:tetratricopeptide repeat protein n=1 Tax=Klebsiella aerogenes TaxID=548 RepID=UPI001952F41E